MDSMVDENGSVDNVVDPLAVSSPESNAASSVQTSSHQLVTATNIVQLTIPAHTQAQVQSVIQPTQQSVIQTAANIQPMLTKNVILVSSKPNTVIQTAQGSLQALQVVETNSEDSYSGDETPKKRRDLLTRRPSYRKILNDLGGGEIADIGHKLCKSSINEVGPKCSERNEIVESAPDVGTEQATSGFLTVIPAGAIQIASQSEGVPGLHTLTMTNAAAGGAIVQYAQSQDGQFFVPEEQARKKELRLMKNREAARECRRKKKEYIKCLENRVAVLENQNKALIEELKSLKELYCQQKTE